MLEGLRVLPVHRLRRLGDGMGALVDEDGEVHVGPVNVVGRAVLATEPEHLRQGDKQRSSMPGYSEPAPQQVSFQAARPCPSSTVTLMR